MGVSGSQYHCWPLPGKTIPLQPFTHCVILASFKITLLFEEQLTVVKSLICKNDLEKCILNPGTCIGFAFKRLLI